MEIRKRLPKKKAIPGAGYGLFIGRAMAAARRRQEEEEYAREHGGRKKPRRKPST